MNLNADSFASDYNKCNHRQHVTKTQTENSCANMFLILSSFRLIIPHDATLGC